MLFGSVKMTYFHYFFQTIAGVLTMERPIDLGPTRLNCKVQGFQRHPTWPYLARPNMPPNMRNVVKYAYLGAYFGLKVLGRGDIKKFFWGLPMDIPFWCWRPWLLVDEFYTTKEFHVARQVFSNFRTVNWGEPYVVGRAKVQMDLRKSHKLDYIS